MSKKIVLLAVLIVALFAFAIVPHMARAATFTVSNTNDSGPGSLRDAITQANGSAGPHTINITASGTIMLTTTDLPSLAQPVTISGPGASTLTINGGGHSIFTIGPGIAVNISNLTLTNSALGVLIGADIANSGNLTVSNVVFSNTSSWAGAVTNWGGSLIISSSSFIGNTASGAGGGLYVAGGTATISNTLFQNNNASAVDGGSAVFAAGTSTTVSQSCFVTNGADYDYSSAAGTSTIDNNWWNSATGAPNAGGDTAGVYGGAPLSPAYLTVAPACGAGSLGGGGGGGTPGGGPPDDRINWQHGDSYAIFYSRLDEHAEPVLHTYCVSAEGRGSLELIVTQDMLDKYPEFPDKPAQNRELFHSNVCRTPFFFYILTTGEYQINVGPDWEGKTEVIIFTGMPPGHVYFYSYDVFHPIQWQ